MAQTFFPLKYKTFKHEYYICNNNLSTFNYSFPLRAPMMLLSWEQSR